MPSRYPKSIIESALAPWEQAKPMFLWVPTNPRTMLLDRVSGTHGEATAGSVPDIGGPNNNIGNSSRGLTFNTGTLFNGYSNPYIAILLVSIEDPASLTGSFLKIGGEASTGVGVGAGDTSFDAPGNKLINILEGFSWGVGPSNAFVKGLNLVHVAATYQSDLLQAGVINTGLYFDRNNGGAWPTTGNTITIGGYSGRGTNARVQAVAIYPMTGTSAEYLAFAQARGADVQHLLGTPYADATALFRETARRNWAVGTVSGGTVALTGQSYTLSQGTHDVGLSKSVTGQSYTHTQGTLSASVSTSATVALTGQSYTLSQGDLGVSTSATVALTGQSYTLSQGDLGVSTSATVALTGQSYTLSQGTFGVSAGSGSTVGLTNQTYTISQGTLGVSTSATVALTGQTYALSQGAPLPTLDLGLANQTISYTQGTLGVSVGATVALTGQIYTHTQGTLGVSVGNNVTVALTGQDLNYSQGTLAPGVALAIAGQTYSLSQGTLAVVVGNNATVALTGQSYSLTQGLVGVAATVGLTGQYISFAQGTLGVTTDTNYYVSLTGQSYALTQGSLGVTNDTNYIVPLTGQSYTYSQRAPSVLGATIPTSEMRLYLVPPEDRRYTVPTY